MDELRTAPTLGVVASLAVLALLAAPYAIVDPGAVGSYYGNGSVNPGIAGLLALVSTIVFAAGREERSDPNLVAGAGLVLGAFVFVLSLLWALTVPESLVTQLSQEQLLQYHRWAVAVAGLAIPASGVWYARALRLI
ncbi:MAG: hypothetical protein ABEH35_00655 [Haloarculaceae archaeon]